MQTLKLTPWVPATSNPSLPSMQCYQKTDWTACTPYCKYIPLSLLRSLLFHNHFDANIIENLELWQAAALCFSGSLFVAWLPFFFFFTPSFPENASISTFYLGKVSDGAQRLHVHLKLSITQLVQHIGRQSSNPQVLWVTAWLEGKDTTSTSQNRCSKASPGLAGFSLFDPTKAQSRVTPDGPWKALWKHVPTRTKRIVLLLGSCPSFGEHSAGELRIKPILTV